ncbi:MAG TPA: AGE family epimerase/isomerase [Rhodothermales bacterium]|nr:AGE family epimerase/isomerase [Rhodothermales bacterium]
MSDLKKNAGRPARHGEAMIELAGRYRVSLLDDVIPFWMKHSLDREHGGYFTCLDRDGRVFDTDKFVWLQGRQVWMFSKLYNELEKRQDWLDVAQLGAQFLRDHGRHPSGDWFFSLTREGRPLTQPYNIFSDCFAAMAFGEFARATGDQEAAEIARATYARILDRQADPGGPFNKQYPGTRPLTGLALPMILSNLTLELAWLLPSEEVDNQCRSALNRIFDLFLDAELGVLHEHVAPDGARVDSFEGRVVIPGHGIEAMWFAMDIAERLGDDALMSKAVDVTLATLEFGWDEEFGGIFYFLDTHGYPPQELEWDQKLWWVHLETLISLLMGYRLTGREECWSWFERIHDYSWSHFPDPQYGEWYGYLNRRGEVLLPLKGGKWKGCFHVPRGLYRCAMELEKLAG